MRHNTALRYVVVAIATVTALILFLPQAQLLLKFGSIAWGDMALAIGLGIALFVWLEAFKPVVRRLATYGSQVPRDVQIAA